MHKVLYKQHTRRRKRDETMTTTANELRKREQDALAVVRNSGAARLKARESLRRHPQLGAEALWGAANNLVGRCPDGCCGGAEVHETFADWITALEAIAAKLVLDEMPEVAPRSTLRTPTRDDEYRLQVAWELAADDAYAAFRDAEDARFDNALERAAESYAGPIVRDEPATFAPGYDYDLTQFHERMGVYSEEASTLRMTHTLATLKVRTKTRVEDFTLTRTRRDRDNDVECWEYTSARGVKLIIWND
jgi:hypothetical protein